MLSDEEIKKNFVRFAKSGQYDIIRTTGRKRQKIDVETLEAHPANRIREIFLQHKGK